MQNKIITITGHKNCRKEFLVADLSKEDGVQYVKPYTNREVLPYLDETYKDMWNCIPTDELSDKAMFEKVLAKTEINGHLYMFFDSQMTAPVNIVFADDYAVASIKENWDNVVTVRVVADDEIQSDRVGEYLYQHEFDYVFDYDKDNYQELKEKLL